MEAPAVILFSFVVFGDRARKTYPRIEQLAESILHNGLIQPIVLAQVNGEFHLDAGGRRYKALDYLRSTEQWDGKLYHGVTSEPNPLRIGFILKGEAFSTPLQRKLTELAENLDRED